MNSHIRAIIIYSLAAAFWTFAAGAIHSPINLVFPVIYFFFVAVLLTNYKGFQKCP
jgi:hypothetical protein